MSNKITAKVFIDSLNFNNDKFNSSSKICISDFYEHSICNDTDYIFCCIDNEYYVDTELISEEIKKMSILWLNCYKKNDKEKFEILMDFYRFKYPELIKVFRSFKKGSLNNRLYLFQAVLFVIDKDIPEWKDSELNNIAKELGSYYTKTIHRLFEDLQKNMKKLNYIKNLDLKIIVTDTKRQDNNGYQLDTMLDFGRLIFENDCLVERAFENIKSSEIWFFSSVHFFSAMRGADIRKLPIYTGTTKEDVKKAIEEKNELFFLNIAIEYVYMINNLNLVPNKTHKYSGINSLHLSVPESYKRIFGTIIAINSINHPNDTQMVITKEFSKKDYYMFFGDEFHKIFGDKTFETRKANKQLLRFIEENNIKNKEEYPLAYVLASIARSHRMSYGNLSPTTAIYLQDTRVDTEEAYHVVEQLFERGCFSFVVLNLLRKVYPEFFGNIDFDEETIALREFDLDANDVLDLKVFHKQANELSLDIFKYLAEEKADLSELLEGLSKGACISKTEGISCLLYSINGKCMHIERSTCLGCEFEIVSKDLLLLLLEKYNKIRVNTDADNEENKKKIAIKKFLNSKILEYLVSIKEVSTKSNIEVVKKLFQEVDENDRIKK